MVNENWLTFLIFLENFMVFSYILESESEFMDSVLVSLWSRLNEVKISPSRSNPGQREKIKLNCYLHTSLWCPKRFYEGLKSLHKTFRDTTKKCKNKNVT